MTILQGLFVRKDDTKGTTPVEARLALAGMFTATGVLDGLTVTGTAGWAYEVAAGSLVSSREPADGVVLFANDSPAVVGTTGEGDTIPPAPLTGARIDIIYALHHDVDNADADSQATFGVASGDPSGSPVAPSIPTGAVELARAVVEAGATDTNHADVTITHTNTPRATLRGTETVRGRRSGSSTTNLPNATATLIGGGNNSGGYHGGVTANSGGLIVPVDGFYSVTCGARYASNTNGVRNLYLYVNGSSVLMESRPAVGFTPVSIAVDLPLKAGDLVQMYGYQNSGGTLGTTDNFGFPYLSIARLGD